MRHGRGNDTYNIVIGVKILTILLLECCRGTTVIKITKVKHTIVTPLPFNILN